MSQFITCTNSPSTSRKLINASPGIRTTKSLPIVFKYQAVQPTHSASCTLDALSPESQLNQEGLRETSSLDQEQKATSLQTSWNLFNLANGIGNIGLPFAVLEGGWMALIAMLVAAPLANYSGRVLVDCMYDRSFGGARTRARPTYVNIGEACWNKYGGTLVLVTQVVELLCLCTMYLVLFGSLLQTTFCFLGIGESAGIALAAMIVLPTLFLRNLKEISYLSCISTASMMFTSTAIVVYCSTKLPIWDVNTLPEWDTRRCLVSSGVVLFSYVIHGVLPSVEGSISDKQNFGTVMNYVFTLCSLCKFIYSLCAYLTFTSQTNEIILNNIPQGPLQIILNSAVCITCLLSYACPMFTVVEVIDAYVTPFPCFDERIKWLWPHVLRTALVCITAGAGILIPHFVLLTSVVGNFCGALIAFILPCLFHLILKGSSLSKVQVFCDSIIILIGFFFGIVGTFYSISAVVDTFKAKNMQI